MAAGRIASVHEWTEADSRAWRARSAAAAGAAGAEGAESEAGVDGVADEAAELVLESNSETGEGEGAGGGEGGGEGGGSGGEGGDSSGGGGGGTLALPPRRYILVHEDGRVHARDRFEPAWGMRRVHLEAAPEPVWVQTDAARWLQSAETLTVRSRASCLAWPTPGPHLASTSTSILSVTRALPEA